MTRRSCLSSKLECLANSQHRKMHVNLRSIDGFASKVLVHLLWFDSLIVDFRFVVEVETMGFSSNGLEKSWTATIKYFSPCITTVTACICILPSGRTEYNQHLTMIHNTLHIPEDVDLSGLPFSKKFLGHAKGLEHDISLQQLEYKLIFATAW